MKEIKENTLKKFFSVSSFFFFFCYLAQVRLKSKKTHQIIVIRINSLLRKINFCFTKFKLNLI